jgi:hypothetical protein
MTAAALSSVLDILSVAEVNTQYPVWAAAALSSVLDILSMAILCLIYSPATSDRGIIYHAVGRGGGRGLFPVSLGYVYPPNSHPLPAYCTTQASS